MVICFIALPVLAIIGIFSATHRAYAREAFDCVFRKVTLRPCNTKLDKRIKAKTVGWLFKKNKKLAGVVHRNFELLSVLFVILTLLSTVGVAIGLYNYYAYGNCNGPHSDAFCVYNAAATVSCGSQHCAQNGCGCGVDESLCTAPDYTPCNGDCDCDKMVCG